MEVMAPSQPVNPPPETVETEDAMFAFVGRFRVLILTSPLWLAAITIALDRFGGEGIRNVVQFLTASPLR